MAGRLDGKSVIITGAASGLGREAAILFAEQGARIVVADMNMEDGQETARMANAEFVRTDVADPQQMQHLIDTTIALYGKLDVMYSNAGVIRLTALADTSDADFDLMIDVNIRGIFNGMRAAARAMLRQGHGCIINTASNGGSFPTGGMAVYSATKAAVIGMTKATAIELAPHTIRVNCVSPGTMITGMTAGLRPEELAYLDTLQPVGRAAHPREMAQAALFLASDEASFVTGHDLIVDGAASSGRFFVAG